MEYHIIFNPAAGRGDSRKAEQDLIRLCRQTFRQYHFHRTQQRGEATEIANSLKDKGAVLIAAGGDGTVHEVVNGMMGSEAVLGIIPLGSGNDFVKMLNIPHDLNASIEIIRRQKIKKVDVGKVNGRYFPNGLGMGFDAIVVMETAKGKFARGFFIYLFSVFRALRRYRNQSITLHLNGSIETRSIFMINVGNGRVLGGGFRLTPNARIDDGMLDVCIFSALTKREVLRNLPKGISGKHVHLPQVEMHQTETMLVEAELGIPVHCDGELLATDLERIEIQLLPQSLRVIHNLDN